MEYVYSRRWNVIALSSQQIKNPHKLAVHALKANNKHPKTTSTDIQNSHVVFTADCE